MKWMPLGLLCGVLSTACGGAAPMSLRAEPRSFTPEDYEDVYNRWTRESDEYSFARLQTVIHVSATFESWEFRWAYVVRYAYDYSLSTTERTRVLRATLADAQERHRFFVTLGSNRYRDGDLTDERSAWRVLLVDEAGRQLQPIEVALVRRPGAAERAYFPTVSRQRWTYRIAFPTQRPNGDPTIGPRAKQVVLRLTGPQGRVDLRWALAGL